MVASCLTTDDDPSSKNVVKRANIEGERPGSDRYQQNHMALIFQQGLSFSGFERNKVFIGQDGPRYVDCSDVSGADSEGDCRAVLVADFDDDGDPDLFVNAIQREHHMLYRNDAGVSTSNGFVKVRLKATAGHPDAIGAIVRLRRDRAVQAQVLSCGGGFESQNALELIFGLGDVEEAELSVLWPGRTEERFGRVKKNGRYLLVEGTGKTTTYPARTFEFKNPLPRGLRLRLGDRLDTLSLIDPSPSAPATARSVKTTSDKPVLLNFWATTCASCILELPLLERLHASGKYRVVGISLDPLELRGAVKKLWAKYDLAFESYLVDESQASRLFDVQRLGIPLSILVSPAGLVTRVLQGRLEEGDL